MSQPPKTRSMLHCHNVHLSKSGKHCLLYTSQETRIQDFFGEFIEVIRQGAFDETNFDDVRFLVNHDFNGIALALSLIHIQMCIRDSTKGTYVNNASTDSHAPSHRGTAYTMTCKMLYVRKGPSVRYRRVGQFSRGEIFLSLIHILWLSTFAKHIAAKRLKKQRGR